MGGPGGTSQPQSAPEVVQTESEQAENEQNDNELAFPCPEFLRDHLGKGRYNIGFAGSSGCGKSSLLNDILGADVAQSDSTECTLEPECYKLPVDDPRGHFCRFMSQLPRLHQDCMSKKLQSVMLWDLPGAGTRLHPTNTYIHDKGLRWFDFVVLFVGDRVLEVDNELIASMVENEVKHFMCRSKLDVMLSNCINQKKKQLQRPVRLEEKMTFAQEEMERVRAKIVQEVRESVPKFHGHCYLLVALAHVDEESPNFNVVSDLHETQRAVDRLLLDVIKDRHGHDLRHFFDHSLYGRSIRSIFDWCSPIFHLPIQEVQEDEPFRTEDLEVCPEESVSQVEVTNGQQWVHLPNSDAAQSVTTEEVIATFSALEPCGDQIQKSEVASVVSELSFSLVSAPQGLGNPSQGSESRCFVPETLFEIDGDKLSNHFIPARDLEKGMHVKSADGEFLKIVRIKRAKAQSIVHLQTASAYLQVTPSHRVMVPSESDGSTHHDVLASSLQTGYKVVCNGGRAEALVSVKEEAADIDVLAITFQPDKAVAVFLPPSTILTKGAKKHKVRRGVAHNKSDTVVVNPSDLVDNARDLVDTDSDIGMPTYKSFDMVD